MNDEGGGFSMFCVKKVPTTIVLQRPNLSFFSTLNYYVIRKFYGTLGEVKRSIPDVVIPSDWIKCLRSKFSKEVCKNKNGLAKFNDTYWGSV